MARGWESKSVEQQMDSAASEKQFPQHPNGPQDAELARKRQSLALSRSRVLQQLKSSSNPRHRRMLEAALADLEAQIARLPDA